MRQSGRGGRAWYAGRIEVLSSGHQWWREPFGRAVGQRGYGPRVLGAKPCGWQRQRWPREARERRSAGGDPASQADVGGCQRGEGHPSGDRSRRGRREAADHREVGTSVGGGRSYDAIPPGAARFGGQSITDRWCGRTSRGVRHRPGRYCRREGRNVESRGRDGTVCDCRAAFVQAAAFSGRGLVQPCGGSCGDAGLSRDPEVRREAAGLVETALRRQAGRLRQPCRVGFEALANRRRLGRRWVTIVGPQPRCGGAIRSPPPRRL
mmetsp:Transcript_9499/g.27477  ORF Transcript_9499/g.27477 Transcript_9499/m.27477 type:complete len:265 (+) Transcript_9499:524-1318(+)